VTAAAKEETVKAEIENGEGLARKLNVTVPSDAVNAEINRLFEDVRKEATLKGFRKGMAPLNVIKAQFGDQVRADAVEKLIKKSLTDVMVEKSLKIASVPTVTAMDFTDDGSLAYTAEIEVMPEIGKVSYDKLELTTEELKVEDKEVDEVVEHYRKQYSELRALSREAREGDVLVADLFKVSDPNKALKEDSFPDSRIDLANPVTIREFREQLPGLKAGQEKEIEVVYDNDYSDADFAGARIKYRVAVKSVNERILPPVDDNLARMTGHGQTALELRLKIRQGLLRQKEDNQRRRHRRDIVDQICAGNEIPVPQGVLADYLDGIIEDYRRQGIEFDENEVKERYRPVGVKSIRWDLLWRQLAEQEKIEVSHEDTENWTKGFAAYNGIEVEQARQMLEKAGKAHQVRDSVLEDKVLGFLMGVARKVPAGK